MNTLDRLIEKGVQHAERLTTLERLVLASGNQATKFQGAVELRDYQDQNANAEQALAALLDILRRANGKTEAIEIGELEAIVDRLAERTFTNTQDQTYLNNRPVPEWK